MDSRDAPRTTARACQFCRRRKIRCDALKPSCTTCRSSNRSCVYQHAPAQPRPSTALLNAVRAEKHELERVLARIKQARGAERDELIDAVELVEGGLSIPAPSPAPASPPPAGYPTPSGSRTNQAADDGDDEESLGGGGVPSFLSLDASRASIFGTGRNKTDSTTSPAEPTSPTAASPASLQPLRYQLVANAATSRQQEYRLRSLASIRGVPAELALHLLDLHWNRQHHTYLLTYRPALMRELVDGGDYCTDFLLNAVFACASKFSERVELRADPADPESAGQDFFARCEDIIARDGVLGRSHIPTVIGLLMLGATYNARGRTSRGWLYTGYALRMVFDLGLHLDSADPAADPETVEIRRRVFWGAFICEKFQSVYLGRPVAIQLRDARVSRDLLDSFEELEPWAPYVDPSSPADATVAARPWTALTYSVSVFQQLCLLARIMTDIINEMYPVTASSAGRPHASLSRLDDALLRWYRDLPPHLVREPWAAADDPLDPAAADTATAPNLAILHTTYHCLVILLHRPAISALHADGDPAAAARSWKRCTTAARNIISLALAHRSAYPLRKSNYMLSYAVYVACTIHAHNASTPTGSSSTADPTAGSSSLLRSGLACLDELAVPNSGAADTARIVRKLMAAKGIPEFPRPPDPQHALPFVSWPPQPPLFGDSPSLDQLPQLQSFSDFGLSGHDLLFGFMDNSFSPSYVMEM